MHSPPLATGSARGVPVPSRMRSRPRSRRGAALLEVAMAAVVLAFGVSAILSVFVSANALRAANHDSGLAEEAARGVLERMVGTPFAEVFATFNADPADDPGGPGTAPGRNFAVAGLTPRPDDADGLVGEVLFPTTPGGAGAVLREDLADARWGLPRDLNGDGAVDGADHAGDYVLLPARVRVRWRGAAGDAELDFDTLLSDR